MKSAAIQSVLMSVSLIVIAAAARAGDDQYNRRTTAGMTNGYGLRDLPDYASLLPKQLDCHMEAHKRQDTDEERLTLDPCKRSGDDARRDLSKFFLMGICEGLDAGAYDATLCTAADLRVFELYEKDDKYPGIMHVPVKVLLEREIQCARRLRIAGLDPCSEEHLRSVVEKWRDVE